MTTAFASAVPSWGYRIIAEPRRPMSDNDGKIYVDASQPATLHNGSTTIPCPTLQEAVLAWYRLPDDERELATVVAADGRIYTAQEIVRLHYRRRIGGGATIKRFTV